MNLQEFSNTFDTLLNSYNTQAQFGKATSYNEITLDEYEKSVLLTQAQDIILKQYFDKNNSLNQGLDDSTRRQMDFSSLITVSKLNKRDNPYFTIIVTKENVTTTTSVASSILVLKNSNTVIIDNTKILSGNYTIQEDSVAGKPKILNLSYTDNTGEIKVTDAIVTNGISTETNPTTWTFQVTEDAVYDERGILYQLPSKILFILNESIKGIYNNITKRYVVIPINYKEYDRQMSRAYSQPLKKQCWRLFQSNNTETITELIPAEGVNVTDYYIRYVRRPRPIILTDLDFTKQEELAIDEVSRASECELNPIIHMDILNKAVELAMSTRGRISPQQQQDNNDRQ